MSEDSRYEEMIYTVNVSYPAKMGNAVVSFTWSRNVQGREQRDIILNFAKTKGLDCSWSFYQPLSVRDVLAELVKTLNEYPVAKS